jgi:hypothetical protein
MSKLPSASAPDQVRFVTPDDGVRIDVRIDNETVWLTQAQIAELFERTQQNVSHHVRGVFSEGELERGSNTKNICIASADRPVTFYSLDVIISVGYRVKSHRGTQFRIWATCTLKERLVQSYRERLYLDKNGCLLRPDGSLRFDDNALVALALPVAESRPAERDLMVRLVLGLLEDAQPVA